MNKVESGDSGNYNFIKRETRPSRKVKTEQTNEQ